MSSILSPEPELLLNGTPIPVVEEVKFLGLIFDRKLSFLPHLRYLKNKCMKALNLIWVVAHTSWGTDQYTVLHLYKSLVRSKLDYRCIIYGSARNSYLRMLDPVQNHALHLCLGAYRTSPSPSLCVLANEPPLFIRRRKLSIEYCLKLSSSTRNPTYGSVFESRFKWFFDRKPNQNSTIRYSSRTRFASSWLQKARHSAIFAFCRSIMALKTNPH